MTRSISEQMLQFIDRCPTAFHVVDEIKTRFGDYTELKENQPWKIVPGGKYFVTRNDSSIIVFTVPEKSVKGFNMAAAHSDCPVFKVKPNGEIVVEDKYLKLNTEKYGGSLLAPWFDRPLSIAGRVVVKTKGTEEFSDITKTNKDAGNTVLSKDTTTSDFKSVLVDLDRDVAIIPNLAIHMNREANDGYKYNPQIDMLPLIGEKDSKGKLLDEIAKQANYDKKDVLGYDLFLYNHMKGIIWGINDEFVSSRSLDDLQCVYALITAFKESDVKKDIVNMCCIFDNEEVGSLTKQGADSSFLEDTIYRIGEALQMSKSQIGIAIANSFMISADNAHAVHPNHTDKADPTNRPYLNGGVVIKYNGNQKYCTDGVSEARLRLLCEKANVPLQTYANRSDIAGGSTLGNLSNAHISVSAVDIGLPQLAMHSPFETAGVKDTEYLIALMKEYWS